MSLIQEQQKKNAGTKEPTIKPVKASPLPVLQPNNSVEELEAAPPEEEVAFSAESQSLLPNSASAPLPPAIEPKAEEEPSLTAPSLDLLPIAPVEIQRAPEKPILETPSIWRDTSVEFGSGAALKPEVANTMLPSFSVSIPDNSTSINRAFYSNSSAIGDFNNKARDEYAAAQKAQAQTQRRGALPNTPDATKRWYSAPLGFLSDVLFGSEEAKKKSEAGIPDLGAGSFGRAGAGVGGALQYVLGFVPKYVVAADAELTKFRARSLQAIGVKKEDAENFARNGFLQFLPETIGGGSGYDGVGTGKIKEGGLNVGALKPSNILQLNFDELNKRNLFVDLVAGDPLNDINEPEGSIKYGRVYTRSHRKEGSSATSDPIGFALQIGLDLFSPGEIPGDVLVSYGVGKLWNAFKKPAAASLENIGKVSSLRQEQQIAQTLSTPTPNPNPGFDLSALTEEQSRRLNAPVPRIGGTSTQGSTSALTTAQESIRELNPPTIDGAIEFSAPSELNPPRLDYGEATIEYTTNPSLPAGANPTNVPRAYTGTTETVRTALPPTFSPSEAPSKGGSYLLPYSTPGKTALEVGIGNPGYRIENPGALALRPLEQVISELRAVEPKLLEGFDGFTWEDFKLHMSDKLEDIGQVSSIGEDLTKTPVRQVSMGRIRERVYSNWKTEDLTAGKVNLFAKPEEKAKQVLGENAKVQSFGDYNVMSSGDIPPQHLEAIGKAEEILAQVGLKTDVPTDVIVDLKNTGAEWVQGNEALILGSGSDAKGLEFSYLHEYAHKLDYLIKSKGKEGHTIYESFVNNPVVKKYFPTQYASKRRFRPNELWAEAFATYLSKKEELTAANPTYAALVEESIGKVKALLSDSSKLQSETTIANEFLAYKKAEAELREDAGNQYLSSLLNLNLSPAKKDELNQYFIRDIYSEESIKKAFYNNTLALTGDDKASLRYAELQALSRADATNFSAKDELAILTSELGKKKKGVRDALAQFNIRGIWETPEAKVLTEDKFKAIVAVPKAKIDDLPLKQLDDIGQVSVIGEDLSKPGELTKRFQELDKAAQAQKEQLRQAANVSKDPNANLTQKFKDIDLKTQAEKEKLKASFSTKTDDLLTAAEELAQHKLALDLPLKQLDELFDETVDFGRKVPESTGADIIAKESALAVVENGGKLNLTPNIFVDSSKLGKRLRDAWLSGDYDTIVEESKKIGVSFEEALESVVERNNSYIEAANKVRNVKPPAEALTSIDSPLFHGTALDGWQPPSNLYVNGSRGELGGGTYFTLSKETAVDYAKARVGDNVNPKTFDTDLNPTVAEVRPSFSATLDARKPLDKNTLKQIFVDLPPEVNKKFVASVNRKKKPISYVKLRELMEESFVKAGVEPTEELLQQADANISKNLRALGFDSVVDKESGFVLSLDNSRVGVVALENVPKPTLIEATTARFNVDSAAAKSYPTYLTADANLRDSTYKVLEQTRAATDKKLTEVQDEIIRRGLPEQDTILPKVESEKTRPSSFVEITDELTESGVCDL